MLNAVRSVREVNVGEKKILLVDDHQDFRELLTLQLRFFGLKVIGVRGGQEALEILQTFVPDLILLDMWMPEMDGFKVVRLVRQNPKYRDIPILATTAMAMPESRDQCLRAGCDDCILKPFRFRELRERLTDLLGKSNLAAAECF